MKTKEIKKILKENLKDTRYRHTIGVMETAVELAEIYDINKKKAKLAGLLHDCAKEISDEEKFALCERYDVRITESERANPTLLHAKCGAILARTVYGVDSVDVLHAISVHTTGCPDMSMLDEIIFVSDYIEPGRCEAPRLPLLRKVAKKDLQMCVFMILEDTMKYLNSRTDIVTDPMTMQTYDFYKKLITESYNSGDRKEF